MDIPWLKILPFFTKYNRELSFQVARKATSSKHDLLIDKTDQYKIYKYFIHMVLKYKIQMYVSINSHLFEVESGLVQL